MWDIINKLPENILNYILPFTYKPQPTILLNDIRTFVELKIIISCLYEKRYHDLLEYEKNADKNWLVSDILIYLRNNKWDYYKRCLYMYNEFMCCKKDSCSQFNIFWGLLSSEERRQFVQKRSLKRI
jgi:hypothetical protein